MTVDELATRGLRVCSLKWSEWYDGGMRCFTAHSKFGTWYMFDHDNQGVEVASEGGFDGRYPTLEAAKAAAEAQHAARVAGMIEVAG